MPTFDFDLTQEAIEYTRDVMAPMAGNAGQESLITSLDIDASLVVTVYIAGPSVDVSKEYDISFTSNHPEAIEQITDKGQDAFEEYAERASDIFNLIDEAFKSL